MRAQRRDRFTCGRRADEHGSRFERVEARVVERVGRRPDVFDVDTVHLLHLFDQQTDEVCVRELDDELVDGAARAPFEDVDTDDVTADRAHPTRHPAERTRPVGQPQSHHIGVNHERHGTSTA